MFRRIEDEVGSATNGVRGSRSRIVVAGPGSSMTIPGIIVSEIVQAFAQLTPVTRIEVDLYSNFKVGLHRAPSLAAAHDALRVSNVVSHKAPINARLRTHMFRDWIGPDVRTAIAYAWPGIDNSWIKQFIRVANAAGASTIVACASLPKSSKFRVAMLADAMYQADLILVGDAADAAELTGMFGPMGPVVETHRSLHLGGRNGRLSVQQITAFLPKEDGDSLSTLLAAFDAIPEAGIDGYNLQVVMRYAGRAMPDKVRRSYHAQQVELIGDDISATDLEKLCSTSSALGIADPAFDSRAFSTAVECGIATVVLTSSLLPQVGRGYVGGLLADIYRPASVHVALSHALRLEEIGFPSPDSWGELAQRLNAKPRLEVESIWLFEPVAQAG